MRETGEFEMGRIASREKVAILSTKVHAVDAYSPHRTACGVILHVGDTRDGSWKEYELNERCLRCIRTVGP